MHLIHTTGLYMRAWPVEPPPYAILSHRWDDSDTEVSYQDFQTGKKKSSSGYLKILRLCKLAKSQNLEWVWIDTACIDKTSSSELSEAINSMFAWYKESRVCFVFFNDNDMLIYNEAAPDVYAEQRLIPSMEHNHNRRFDPSTTEEFANSWFGRGWTLQELLAPTSLIFYYTHALSADDLTCTRDELDTRLFRATTMLGTKDELKDRLISATGIREEYLLHRRNIMEASIAERMSWASRRTTTRPEDIAYCLLGFFGINMTLLYGERHNAFLRLQETILASNNDETIFAWASNGEETHRGLLASSPAEFGRYSCAQPFKNVVYRPPVRITGGGIEVHNVLSYYLPKLAPLFYFWTRLTTRCGPTTVRPLNMITDMHLACICQCGASPQNENLTVTLQLYLEDDYFWAWESTLSGWTRSNPQCLKPESRFFRSLCNGPPVFVSPWLNELSKRHSIYQKPLEFDQAQLDISIKLMRIFLSTAGLVLAGLPHTRPARWYYFTLGYACAPNRLIYVMTGFFFLFDPLSFDALLFRPLHNLFALYILLWYIFSHQIELTRTSGRTAKSTRL